MMTGWKNNKVLKVMALALLLAALPSLVLAQDMSPAEGDATEGQAVGPAKLQVNPNSMPSLFFTYWEHGAILDAKRSRGSVRPPTAAELQAGLGKPEGYVPPPEERELKLGGIVFKSTSEWTIWLNGERVTPKAVPADVIDLRVNKNYIDIKWFDTYTNQIFPIRLRPHQRFNFDTRIFLPG